MKKRVFSVVLAAMMVATIVPMGTFTSLAADEIGFDDFAKSAVNMLNKYDEDNTREGKGIKVGSIESEESNEFELKRLIVKSSRKLDDMDAVAKVEGYDDLHIFQYATEKETEEAYNYYTGLKSVEYVDIDTIVTLDETEVETESTLTRIADETEYKSWGASFIGVPDFKDFVLNEHYISDLPQVTVAVIDTGIDTDHEMFNGFYDEIENPEGRILNNGYDFSNDDNDPEDDHRHGTHVSGTITELTLSNVKILPIKVLNDSGRGSMITVCLGMEYAVEQGANVVNMSLGGTGSSLRGEEIVEDGYEKGTIFVVAAGNENDDARYHTPAGIEKCITVSAVDSEFKKASFSNYGDVVDVAAPGVGILSAKMGDSSGYVTLSGTSMASPHVAGVAALYVTNNPDLSVHQLEQLIKSNAIDEGEEGFDQIYGYGIIYAGLNFKIIELSFDHESGKYDGPFELRINSSDPDAKIYYTLDGTAPTTSSILYEEPIAINESLVVNAVVYKEKDGNLYRLSYTLLKKIFYMGDILPDFLLKFEKETGTITGIEKIVPIEDVKVLYIPSQMYGVEVKAIGKRAFYDCTNLTAITIPDSVKSMGEWAFYNCTNLTSIDIPDSVESLGNYIFYNCSGLASVIIGKSVKSIGSHAFSSCSSLTDIEIPDSVESIGERAFSSCNRITNIDIPVNVKSIGSAAFFGCSNLISITVDEDNAYYSSEDGILYNKDKTSLVKYPVKKADTTLVIPDSVTSIEESAFNGSSNLINIDIPDGVTSIESYAFALCQKLTSIEIPAGLTSIESGVFSTCSKLTNVDIPAGVTSIARYAFTNCIKLKSVTIPLSVTSIENYAFKSCSALSDVYYSGTEDQWNNILNIEGNEYLANATIHYACCKVIFKDYDGTVLKTQIVEYGEAATAPSDPEREDYTFIGWDPADFSNVTSDLIVTAKYRPNKCTVVFKDYDGTELKTEKVEYGKGATAPDNPTREGYTFTGWDPADFSNVTEDLIVTAQYSINTYTVAFINYDETILSTQTVEYGSSATAPEVPERAGYAFTGWDKEFDNVKEDLTVTAQYVKTYTVEFKDYNGDVIDTQTVAQGEAAVAPNDPTREGYAFIGWDKEFNNVAEDLIVTAQYSINTYTVTFINYDGTTLGTQTVEYGSSATAPEVPEREGYVFTGWDKEFDNVKENLTVTAQYVKTYTVEFKDYNGDVIDTQTVAQGEAAVAPANPTRDGYTFVGWDPADFSNITEKLIVIAQYRLNKCTVIFKDYDGTELKVEEVEYGKAATAPADPEREGYTFISWDKDYSNVTEDLIVTAQYDINAYVVAFKDYDGNFLKMQAVKYGKAATAPSDPERKGYTFLGWDKDYSNVTEDLIISAQYEINTYTVTFKNYNGAKLKTQNVEYGKSATAPATPNRTGYTFIGWDKEFDNVSSDLTVTAQYKINTFTVTFKDYDGTVLKTETVNYGGSATAPNDPTREGYTFTGWDKTFNKITSDLTVTAVYKINKYEITFKAGNNKAEKAGEYTKVNVEYGQDPSSVVNKDKLNAAKIGSWLFRLFCKPTGKWTDKDGNVVTGIPSNDTDLYAQYKLFGIFTLR